MVRSRTIDTDVGQATVEFALILPFFVLLIVTLFDITAIVRDQLHVDALARDAAR
ncbi:MAG: TadE family protein, partial [Ilumatobacteraceae bacterium]